MSVSLDFDKPRQLKFDLAAVRDLEAALNKPLAAVLDDIMHLGVNALVLSLWAGLKHEDRTLNPKLVERMLTAYIEKKRSLRILGRAINDAMDETGLFRDETDESALEGNSQPELSTTTTTNQS
jgi:hypothetical protein